MERYFLDEAFFENFDDDYRDYHRAISTIAVDYARGYQNYTTFDRACRAAGNRQGNEDFHLILYSYFIFYEYEYPSDGWSQAIQQLQQDGWAAITINDGSNVPIIAFTLKQCAAAA